MEMSKKGMMGKIGFSLEGAIRTDSKKGSLLENPKQIVSADFPIITKMISELWETHQFSDRAIARILHLEVEIVRKVKERIKP